jgi:hypothetical protein
MKYGIPPQSAQQPVPSSAPASPSAQDRANRASANADEGDDSDEPEKPEIKPAPKPPDTRPIKFAKGKLLSSDCTHPPAAILKIQIGIGIMKFRVEDYKSMTLIGAEEFSCDWKDRPVAVNYKLGSKLTGDLVSLELD